MSERERSQCERGARRAGLPAAPSGGAGMDIAPVALSEERTLSEREGSQRERGARRAGRLAAPSGGAGTDIAPVALSEERTQ